MAAVTSLPWTSIFDSLQEKPLSLSKSRQDSYLLCLGPNSAGHKSVLKVLWQKSWDSFEIDETFHSEMLYMEYTSIAVPLPDDQKEETGILHIYSLHEDNKELIQTMVKFIANSGMKRLGIFIILDLMKPWTIKAEIKKWLDVANEILLQTYNTLTDEERDARFQKGQGSSLGVSPGASFGVPILFVISNSHNAGALDSRNCRGQWQVVLAHMRRLCLSAKGGICFLPGSEAGAGALTSSSRRLFDYLLHILYQFPFKEEINLSVPEQIFIPCGSDSEESVNEYVKTTRAENFDVPFESIIAEPVSSDAMTIDEEDLQVPTLFDFLSKSSAGTKASKTSQGSPPSEVAQRHESLQHSDSKGSNNESSQSLRSFFSNLLKRPADGSTLADGIIASNGSPEIGGLKPKLETTSSGETSPKKEKSLVKEEEKEEQTEKQLTERRSSSKIETPEADISSASQVESTFFDTKLLKSPQQNVKNSTQSFLKNSPTLRTSEITAKKVVVTKSPEVPGKSFGTNAPKRLSGTGTSSATGSSRPSVTTSQPKLRQTPTIPSNKKPEGSESKSPAGKSTTGVTRPSGGRPSMR